LWLCVFSTPTISSRWPLCSFSVRMRRRSPVRSIFLFGTSKPGSSVRVNDCPCRHPRTWTVDSFFGACEAGGGACQAMRPAIATKTRSIRMLFSLALGLEILLELRIDSVARLFGQRYLFRRFIEPACHHVEHRQVVVSLADGGVVVERRFVRSLR